MIDSIIPMHFDWYRGDLSIRRSEKNGLRSKHFQILKMRFKRAQADAVWVYRVTVSIDLPMPILSFQVSLFVFSHPDLFSRLHFRTGLT